MKHILLLISAAVFVLTAPVAAQMMHGDMMGGRPRGMINLVSPADSPTQILRGAISIVSSVSGMMGSGMPGPNGNGTSTVRVMLRLFGVTDTEGLVTNTGNHLIVEGQLTTPTGNRAPINVDQRFALTAGVAMIQVPVSLPSITGPATITIDRLAVQDSGGNEFAVPGVSLVQAISQTTPGPTPRVTPQPTAGGGCTSNHDCPDGDICMPMGRCGHTEPGGGPMM